MTKSKFKRPERVSVSGKGVLISGGTTGIGRATALLLASEGAKVMILGRSPDELNDALRDLQTVSQACFGFNADVTNPRDIAKTFAEADQKLGSVDILINNAAVGAGGINEGSYEDWDYIVRTNLLGYIAMAHDAAQRMKRAGGGHIVNIGSMSAEVRDAGSSLYVATKSALQGWCESLRKELNPDGVKVTLIEPGAVGSDMQESSPEEQREKIRKLEMLTAEDIAECVLYCVTQPKRCDLVGVQIRPHLQLI